MNVGELIRLRDLTAEHCIRKGDFTLASGMAAKYYYDGKQTTLQPEAAKIIGKLVLELLREVQAEAVGGMALGADPIAQAASLASLDDGGVPIPAFIVRAAAKDHGTREQTSAGFALDNEPLLKDGRRVVIVDDVITTGGSINGAIEAVEAKGCRVVAVMALVERHENGGANLTLRGYDFRRLFYTDSNGDLYIDQQLLRRAEAAA